VAGGFLVTLLAAATYATVGSSSKLAGAAGLGPIGYLEWRAVAAVVALGVLLAVGARAAWIRLPPLDAIPRREQGMLLLASAANLLITGAMIVAFSRVNVAVALILFYASPALVALLSVRFHGERLGRLRVGALLLAFAGLGLVVLAPLASADGVATDPVGLLLAGSAAVLQALYMLVAARGYPSVPAPLAVGVIFVFAIPGNLVLALLLGALPEVGAPFSDPALLIWAIAGGVIGAAIPATALQHGMRGLGATGAAVVMMVEPFIAAAYAFLLLGEALGPLQVAGGAMVVAAGMLLQRGARPGPRARPGGTVTADGAT
jgi:drug/metabolite transporter (DMT)-like permease